MPNPPRKPAAALAPVPDESGGGGGAFVLSDCIAEKRAEHPPITIDLGGDVISVDPVELWPDEVVNLISAEQPVAAIRVLLGADYERYTKAGGTATLLLGLLQRGGALTVGESQAS